MSHTAPMVSHESPNCNTVLRRMPSATTENVAHVAMLLFAGYIDAATSMSESCGGGGSTPSSGWGKKDDEDDWKFAHRCAQMVHSVCKPKPRSRSFHR